MFQIIQPLSKILKIKKINASDFSFMLHTKLTVLFLILFSVILSAKEFFGTPIHCYFENESQKSYLNDYCWTTGTFILSNTTVPSHPEYNGITFEYHWKIMENGRIQNKIYQRYYPWIVLVLIFQATLCYLPAFLWKIYERGLMSYLCEGFDFVFPDTSASSHKRKVIEYFKNKSTSSIRTVYVHRFYGLKLLICVNVIINMVMLNIVVPNFWTNYAPAVFSLLTGNWMQWLKHSFEVFPKLASCHFYHVGPSGTFQKKDALCLLPLNMFNDKVFAFLWLWFILLIFESFVSVVLTLSMVFNKTQRFYALKRRVSVSPEKLRIITNNASLGDWFVLYQMTKNLNPADFGDIILELATQISGDKILEFEKMRESKI